MNNKEKINKIKNSSYYVVKKCCSSNKRIHKYIANFYTSDGSYIKSVHITLKKKDNEIIPMLEKLLDPKFMHMAKPKIIKFCTHEKGGYNVNIIDKNENILFNRHYDNKFNKEDFINKQLFDCKYPILIDYEWLIGGEIEFVNETESNNKNIKNLSSKKNFINCNVL